jgi:hypothetical protein
MLLNGTRARFEEFLLKVRLPGAVSPSPTVNPSALVAVSSLIVWSAIPLMVGGVFTAFTVNTKVSLALFVPSLTLTVIVAVPIWSAAGVTVTVRLLPLPPKTMLLNGTSARFDESFPNVRLPTDVSASPIVKGSAAVAVLTVMD